MRREEEIKRGIQEYQDYAKDAAKLKAAANTTLGAAPEACAGGEGGRCGEWVGWGGFGLGDEGCGYVRVR